MRLFIALEPPADTIQQVVEWQTANQPPNTYLEPASNLHMTLAFLGEQPDELLPSLRQAIDLAWRETSITGAIEYRELDRLGMLVYRDDGQGQEMCSALNAELQRLIGYTPQFSPWLPHITIWRFAPENKPGLQPVDLPQAQFTPTSAHVYTSIKNPAGGATYQPVASRTANIFDPIHDELDQAVYNGIKPKDKHVDFLRRLYFRALNQELGVTGEEWADMYLTGSLTTYQWGETSDCDVSIFPDYDKIWAELDIDPNTARKQLIHMSIEHLDGTFLPGTTHPIQFFVVPPGTLPGDLYQPGLRSAFDLHDRLWIVPPERERSHNIETEMPELFRRASEMADKMSEMLDHDKEAARQLWHDIHKKRQLDQTAGMGDYSEGNIVYKYLLNQGLFERIRNELGEYIAKTAGGVFVVNEGWYCDECGNGPWKNLELFALHREGVHGWTPKPDQRAWSKSAGVQMVYVPGGEEMMDRESMPWVYRVEQQELYYSDWGAYHRPILKHINSRAEHAMDVRAPNLVAGLLKRNGNVLVTGGNQTVPLDEVKMKLVGMLLNERESNRPFRIVGPSAERYEFRIPQKVIDNAIATMTCIECKHHMYKENGTVWCPQCGWEPPHYQEPNYIQPGQSMAEYQRSSGQVIQFPMKGRQYERAQIGDVVTIYDMDDKRIYYGNDLAAHMDATYVMPIEQFQEYVSTGFWKRVASAGVETFVLIDPDYAWRYSDVERSEVISQLEMLRIQYPKLNFSYGDGWWAHKGWGVEVPGPITTRGEYLALLHEIGHHVLERDTDPEWEHTEYVPSVETEPGVFDYGSPWVPGEGSPFNVDENILESEAQVTKWALDNSVVPLEADDVRFLIEMQKTYHNDYVHFTPPTWKGLIEQYGKLGAWNGDKESLFNMMQMALMGSPTRKATDPKFLATMDIFGEHLEIPPEDMERYIAEWVAREQVRAEENRRRFDEAQRQMDEARAQTDAEYARLREQYGDEVNSILHRFDQFKPEEAPNFAGDTYDAVDYAVNQGWEWKFIYSRPHGAWVWADAETHDYNGVYPHTYAMMDLKEQAEVPLVRDDMAGGWVVRAPLDPNAEMEYDFEDGKPWLVRVLSGDKISYEELLQAMGLDASETGIERIGRALRMQEKRADWRDDRVTTKVLYDYESDRIILGTSADLDDLPDYKILGDYRDGDVTLYEAEKQWINSNYFHRLWTHSYPERPLNNVYFKRGEEMVKLRHLPRKRADWDKPVPRFYEGDAVVMKAYGESGTIVGDAVWKESDGQWWYAVDTYTVDGSVGIVLYPEDDMVRPSRYDRPDETNMEDWLGIPPSGESYFRTAPKSL